jgi:hypothetical protein
MAVAFIVMRANGRCPTVRHATLEEVPGGGPEDRGELIGDGHLDSRGPHH